VEPLFLPSALTSISRLPIGTTSLLPKLVDLIGSLHHVYRSENQTFVYFDSKLHFQNFTTPYDFVNVSAGTILNAKPSSSSSSSHYYYYYSGNLMQDELMSFRQFLDTSVWVQELIGKRPVTALLWLGTEGVRANAHYDSVYNVFVHLAGVKTVRLVAPRYAPRLRFFGRYHPHACQSRYSDLKSQFITNINMSYRCIELSDTSLCDVSSKLQLHDNGTQGIEEDNVHFKVQEFTLRSGDVLFIPPLWTHEVSL